MAVTATDRAAERAGGRLHYTYKKALIMLSDGLNTEGPLARLR
jgi:hypothetical protein